jgi:NADH-ubiquinone oxidoreductase chain 1
VFSTLAECHRAPFDFSESESELVSGFNTEYIGSFFAFVFLAEYSALLVSSGLISYLFFGVFIKRVFRFSLFVVIVRFLFIVIRVTFCRFRYDLLIISA